MTQLHRLKVKAQFKVIGLTLEFSVRSISSEPFERFSLNFGQILIIMRECAAHHSATKTHCHTLRSWNLPLNLVPAPYLLNPLNDFH